jgi:isopropylmalate/homocitrate/citramalate synthase
VSPNTNVDGRPWMSDGRFYTAPMNYNDQVRESFQGAAGPVQNRLYDSTVRKILLTPGIRPSIAGMVRVAREIEAAGVTNFTLNIHWWKEREPEALEWAVAEEILKRKFAFSTTITLDTAWADHWRIGVARLAELGMVRPVFLVQPMREDRGKRSGEEVYDRVKMLMSECAAMGVEPGLMLTDAGRASWEDLVGLSKAGIEHGATLLNVTDSGSSLSHHGMRVLLQQLRAEVGSDVEFLVHTHDDFGLGTAVALETVAVGDSIELSFNGISDRAGFPSFEEVVVCLESMYGVDTGLDVSRFATVCNAVSAEAIPPHPWKALSGAHAFMLDLPYAAAPALEHGKGSFPPVWNCVDPTWLGYSAEMHWLRQFMMGSVLAAKLESLHLPTDPESVRRVKTALIGRFAAMREYPVWVTEEEFDELCQLTLSQG